MVEKAPKVKPDFNKSYIDYQKGQNWDEGFKAAKKAHKKASRDVDEAW